jgi:hypothetical protein
VIVFFYSTLLSCVFLHTDSRVYIHWSAMIFLKCPLGGACGFRSKLIVLTMSVCDENEMGAETAKKKKKKKKKN